MGIFGVAWENLVVGIGAALLVGAVLRAKDMAYNKYLERQYPIAGEYITTWEQEVDGEVVTESAPATLKQRGTEITGRSEMPDSDLEWIFEGEISETGYLNGLYYSSNPHNTSIGNFFFHINHDGELEGLWSGYQERNETINSGRYRFVPVLDAYSTRPVRRQDVPAAVDIAEQQLPRESGTAASLTRTLDDESGYFGHVAQIDTEFESERSLAANLTDVLLSDSPRVTESGPGDPVASEVIGFCLGAVLDQEGFRAALHAPESDLSKALRHADRVGLLQTVAVKDGFETRGIGTALVERWITECVERGATALCAVGWETDTGVNVGGIMEYFGFREITRVEDYWREADQRRDCENCHDAPCSCTAVVYARYQPSVDLPE